MTNQPHNPDDDLREAIIKLCFVDGASNPEYTADKILALFATQTAQNGGVDKLIKRLRRIASPDEITGDGATEDMTGPAANEMRHRMKEAGKIADDLALTLAQLKERVLTQKINGFYTQHMTNGSVQHVTGGFVPVAAIEDIFKELP